MTRTYRLNGDTRCWRPGITIRQTLTTEGVDGTWFAVALNGEVVPSSQWAETSVPDDSELEIIAPCQGG